MTAMNAYDSLSYSISSALHAVYTALWFMQAEISMQNVSVTSDSTTVDTVLAIFYLEVLCAVKDIISTNLSHVNIYQLLKTCVISTFALYAEAKLRQFLKGKVLTDEEPSLIFSRLRNSNTASFDPTSVLSVFMEQLPPTL